MNHLLHHLRWFLMISTINKRHQNCRHTGARLQRPCPARGHDPRGRECGATELLARRGTRPH